MSHPPSSFLPIAVCTLRVEFEAAWSRAPARAGVRVCLPLAILPLPTSPALLLVPLPSSGLGAPFVEVILEFSLIVPQAQTFGNNSPGTWRGGGGAGGSGVRKGDICP